LLRGGASVWPSLHPVHRGTRRISIQKSARPKAPGRPKAARPKRPKGQRSKSGSTSFVLTPASAIWKESRISILAEIATLDKHVACRSATPDRNAICTQYQLGLESFKTREDGKQ